MKRRSFLKVSLGAVATIAAVFAGSIGIATADQGIYDDKIVLGSHQPLSGPVALWGVPVTNGMRMAVDEINANGGVNGRMIELIVEDSAYQQNKAAQAGDKLLKKDKVFALIGALGTPTNMVTMPRALKMGVLNVFPVTAANEMFEPYHKLKFGGFTPYSDQMQAAVKYFVDNKGIKKIGVLYQDDDFGKNVLHGCEDQAKDMGLPEVVKTNFKRGAKDFSSQIAQLKSEGVELVCLGTIIGETIGSMATAKKIGYDPIFVVSSAGYVPENVTLAKGLTEGLYGTGQSPIPYYEDATPEVKAWMDDYKARFGADAVLQSIAGYDAMQVFGMALEKAGRDITAEKVAEAIESIKDYQNIFGGAPYSFSAEDHLGPDARNSATLYQVVGDKWQKVSAISY
ncbi:ABC transporter substrate-binding protein [uncultured Sneathiella sp.]|jgi:branched-chain amino acid transport system substrate-binding protein|uniref:ABC transporter substrate-binding protein n=1 Tax=uncultured Sneathiella sp. TaxID=879315 RepID=UPI00259AD08D|nr:ABC transporter substrate-binding protein [uncultured Sneathiella sp.]